MKSLAEYISGLNIHLPRNDIPVFDAGTNELSNLLTHCFIQENTKQHPLPNFNSLDKGSSSFHFEVLDICILYLLQNKYTNNVLTYGYQLAKNSEVLTTLFCLATNTNVSVLKSSVWRLFHELVGTQPFAFILINCSAYLYLGNHFRQIAGNPANSPHVSKIWADQLSGSTSRRHLDWNNILYQNYERHDGIEIINTDANKLYFEIFSNLWTNKAIPRSHRIIRAKLIPIMRRFIQLHAKVPLRKMLDQICCKDDNFHAFQKDVNTFLVVALGKLVPRKLLGSRQNAKILYSAVSTLIRKPLRSRLLFAELCVGLQTTNTTWFHSRDEKAKLTLDEFKLLTSYMNELFFWLLSSYVPKLITRFFYVTEISSTADVVYIRHNVWKILSKPYLKMYFRRYLTENKECLEHKSFLLSKFNHRNLRLIPKKSGRDFRVIAVPCKGVDVNELSEYNDYLRNCLRPTKVVLETLRLLRDNRILKAFSPLQIPKIVTDYKHRLLAKFERLPTLYCLKFDIKSCYDSIPIKKVLDLVKDSFSKESLFRIRTQNIIESTTTRLKIVHSVNGRLEFGENDLLIDGGKTTVLSKDDIMSIVEMEILKTSIFYRGKCYLRKEGLFQGAPLSSVLVDILYDSLLESYSEFQYDEEANPMIIRLVDDFLVLSTSESYINNIHTLAQKGFNKFNAEINPEKVLLTSSLSGQSEGVKFCGIQLNVKTLDVWKDSDSFTTIRNFNGTSKQAYIKLLKIFEMRLSYDVLDEEVKSQEIALKYFEEISINLAESFVSLFNNRRLNLKAFEEFLSNIFGRIDTHLIYNNIRSREYARLLKSKILDILLQKMHLKRLQFEDIIRASTDLRLMTSL